MRFAVHPAWDAETYKEDLAEQFKKLDHQWSTVRTVTAYSSTPEQTDDTPYQTASMTHVRYGIVAANWLPIGTKVKMPELFEDQVFVVEDRMNDKHKNRMDIWMPSEKEARNFGKQTTKVVIVE